MTHLQAVPDLQLSHGGTAATDEQPEGTWALDLGEHDGQPCPECHTTHGIPWAVGIHDGTGRLCTTCTAADNPVLADAIEAVDALDTALAFSAIGQPRLVLSVLIAQAVAHVIDTRSAEETL